MSQNTSPRIAIVDYGTGNIGSIRKCLELMLVHATVASRASDLLYADKIILPGVGHFARAMEHLARAGLLDVLNEAVLMKKKPVLGICLGMELMGDRSEEGDVTGLGWIRGATRRFRVSDKLRYKVPHMGWNQVYSRRPEELMKGVPDPSEFYFAHSYHLEVEDPSDVIGETAYDGPFVSAVRRGNIVGVQFHPEKSREAGQRLLKNFIEI